MISGWQLRRREQDAHNVIVGCAWDYDVEGYDLQRRVTQVRAIARRATHWIGCGAAAQVKADYMLASTYQPSNQNGYLSRRNYVRRVSAFVAQRQSLPNCPPCRNLVDASQRSIMPRMHILN